jgi:hypothetical protein
VTDFVKFNEGEQKANDAVLVAMREIMSWDEGLQYNNEELVESVHVIQSFIKQHLLKRLNSDFSDWWRLDEE